MTHTSNRPWQDKIASLSRRELQIARAYSTGRSYRDIAKELLIAPDTVRSHIRTIYRKLEVASKIALLGCLHNDFPATANSAQLCRAPAAPGTVTVVVLPPRYLSCDSSTTPLARAIHEGLLAELSRYRHYSLIADKSFLCRQLADVDPLDGLGQVGADFVIDGSLRKIENKLRFTFFLIETDTRRFLWAKRFDRSPSTILSDHDGLIGEVVATITAHIGSIAHEGDLSSWRRENDGSLWGKRNLTDFLFAFDDPRFEPLVRHWLALRQENAVPHRSAVDPSKFIDSHSMIWLMERHEDGQYRYCMAGQRISEIHGGIGRRADTDSLFNQQALDMFRPRWQAVLDQRQLVRAEGVVMLAGGNQAYHVERLMLPLRSDNGDISVILGATHYDTPQGSGLTATAFPPTNVQHCPLEGIPLGASL